MNLNKLLNELEETGIKVTVYTTPRGLTELSLNWNINGNVVFEKGELYLTSNLEEVSDKVFHKVSGCKEDMIDLICEKWGLQRKGNYFRGQRIYP